MTFLKSGTTLRVLSVNVGNRVGMLWLPRTAILHQKAGAMAAMRKRFLCGAGGVGPLMMVAVLGAVAFSTARADPVPSVMSAAAESMEGGVTSVSIQTEVNFAGFIEFLDDETVAIWSLYEPNWATVTAEGVLNSYTSHGRPVAIWADNGIISVLSKSEKGLFLQEGDRVIHSIPPIPMASSIAYDSKTDVGYANADFGNELVTFSMRNETSDFIRYLTALAGIDASADGRFILASTSEGIKTETGCYKSVATTKIVDLFEDQEILLVQEEGELGRYKFTLMKSRLSSEGNLAFVYGYRNHDAEAAWGMLVPGP